MLNNGLNQDLLLVLSIYVLNLFINQYMGMSQNIQLLVSQQKNVLNLQKELLNNKLEKGESMKLVGFI
jgi:hypothetical protein